MTSEDFIKAIRIAVYESAIENTLSVLKEPPGRRTSPGDVALSEWYNRLPAHDKERVRATVRHAVRAAVFGVLAVLDGVRSIWNSPEEMGSFELRYVLGGKSVLLTDPDAELLHDLFVGEVPQE
jgi:hypothetical protein